MKTGYRLEFAMQYFEVYCDDYYDLLQPRKKVYIGSGLGNPHDNTKRSPDPLPLHEYKDKPIQIAGLSAQPFSTIGEFTEIFS
jgi:hypothetical protein